MNRTNPHELILDCNRTAQAERRDRAGLRRQPVSTGSPTGLFEAVELAVLVVVALLAMTSIIVSSGCSGIEDAAASTHAPAQSNQVRS